MATVSNINMIGELKELIPQYIRGYLVQNSANKPIFDVQAVNLGEFSASPKSLINVYDWRIEDVPQESGICRERQAVYFSVAIRKMDGVGSQFDLQAGYIRAIFAGKGVMLNTFSGTFNGSSFTNKRLSYFGLFDFRISQMREVYSQNTAYYIFSVVCKVQFKNRFPSLT